MFNKKQRTQVLPQVLYFVCKMEPPVRIELTT